MSGVSPVAAGWACKCPECGEGEFFDGYLKPNDACPKCGADFTVADLGDGPAFFVMFAAFIVILPTAMLFELLVSPPVWVHVLIWPPVVLGFNMWLLRPVKAILFALQWKNKAEEARFED